MIIVSGTVHLGRLKSGVPGMTGIVTKELRQAATEGAEIAANIARTKYLSGPYPTYLQPRTGRLRASWQRGNADNLYRETAEGLVMTVEIGSRLHRALFERLPGTTITPTRSQYLRIPTSFIKTAAGVVKGPYQVKDARTIPNTFVARSKKGNLLIFQTQVSGRGRAKAQIIPIFVLKPSVYVKARPVVAPTERDAQPIIEQNLAGHMARAERTIQDLLA